MHELSIALTIIERVQTEINRRRLSNLRTIGVRVGALSAVDPEALVFGFSAASRETALDGVKLEIEWVPASIRCNSCGHINRPEQMVFACEQCDSTKIEVEHGYELDIVYLEADEPE